MFPLPPTPQALCPLAPAPMPPRRMDARCPNSNRSAAGLTIDADRRATCPLCGRRVGLDRSGMQFRPHLPHGNSPSLHQRRVSGKPLRKPDGRADALFAALRRMVTCDANPTYLSARQLQLWSIDAGMAHVPLANLQRFADLVRADMRAAMATAAPPRPR